MPSYWERQIAVGDFCVVIKAISCGIIFLAVCTEALLKD